MLFSDGPLYVYTIEMEIDHANSVSDGYFTIQMTGTEDTMAERTVRMTFDTENRFIFHPINTSLVV